jgi:ankyrin repeat protein
MIARLTRITLTLTILTLLNACVSAPSSQALNVFKTQDQNKILTFLNNPENLKKDAYGNHPLHYAVQTGNTEYVSAILNQGVDIEIKDAMGKTPLATAVNTESFEPYKDVSDLLVEKGANVNATMGDYYVLCFAHQTEAVDYLISKGATLNNDKAKSSCLSLYAKMVSIYQTPSATPDKNGKVNLIAVLANSGDASALKTLQVYKNTRVKNSSRFKEMLDRGMNLDKFGPEYEEILKVLRPLKDEEAEELVNLLEKYEG